MYVFMESNYELILHVSSCILLVAAGFSRLVLRFAGLLFSAWRL